MSKEIGRRKIPHFLRREIGTSTVDSSDTLNLMGKFSIDSLTFEACFPSFLKVWQIFPVSDIKLKPSGKFLLVWRRGKVCVDLQLGEIRNQRAFSHPGYQTSNLQDL